MSQPKQNWQRAFQAKQALPDKERPLPAVPMSLLNIVRMLDDPDIEARQLVRYVEAEPSLTANLLRVANSPRFSLRGRVGEIGKALVLIGLDEVKRISLTAALGQMVGHAAETGFVQDCWRHSVASAVIAVDLTPRLAGAEPNRIYMSALLHEMGRLLFLRQYPSTYAEILQFASHGTVDIEALEKEQFGRTQAEAGALLAEEWGFPDHLVRAIRHQSESQEFSDPLGEAVCLACRVAHRLGYPAVPGAMSAGAEELPEFVMAQLERLETTLPEKIAEFAPGLAKH